jgi:hypothetical protein
VEVALETPLPVALSCQELPAVKDAVQQFFARGACGFDARLGSVLGVVAVARGGREDERAQGTVACGLVVALGET